MRWGVPIPILGAAAVVATGGLYLWPLTSPGIWIAGDNPFYLSVAYAVDENLRTSQTFLGWSNHDLGGFPLFSPFIPAVLGILSVLVVHHVAQVPLPAAYKLMLGVAVLLPPLSLWAVLVRRVGARVAFLVANLCLLLTYHLVQPLNGAWGTYLAAGLLLACLGVGEAWLREGPSWSRALAIIALASVVVLSDASAWIALPCGVAALCIVCGVRDRKTPRMTGWIVLALGPLAVWYALLTRGTGASWGLGPEAPPSFGAILIRLPAWFLFPGSRQLITEELIPAIQAMEWSTAALLGGRILLEHLPELAVLALALVGATRILSRSHQIPEPLQRWSTAHLVWVMLLLLAVLLPRETSGGLMQSERLVPYVNMALLILGAMALRDLELRLGSSRQQRLTVILLLALTVSHGARYLTYGEYVLLKAADRSVVHEELTDVWRYLRSHATKTQTRVLYETLEGLGFLDGGNSNLAALATHETELPSLASWRLPSLAWARGPQLLAQNYPLRPLSRLPDFMRRWNCSYLVVWWPGTREQLRASGTFDIVHESPNRLFAVLQLRGYEPSWLEFQWHVPRGETEAVRNGYLRFRAENPATGNRAVLKMTYHPGWRLLVNGQEVSLVAVDQQIGTGPLPAGPLELTFVFDMSGPKAT